MKEIGSEFELDPFLLKAKDKDWSNFFPMKNKVFLSTGRDSLIYAIRACNFQKMLVPSYIEESVLAQIVKEGISIDFYKIDSNLRVNLSDIEKKTNDADSLLIIHYFGFPQPIKEIESLCKKRNLVMIEDCVQSMLSSYAGKPLGSFGMVSFNSLRKFIGIPDGSILFISKKTNVIESRLHKEFVKKRTNALLGKYHYLNGDKNYSRLYFQKAFYEAEKIIDKYPKPALMSLKSKEILKKIDFPQIIKMRRKNFKFLLSKLHSIALYKKLPQNVCPLGFPIITKKRDKIKTLLIKNKIYPPIHWILPYEIRKEFRISRLISDHILTIPIDQRYTITDMMRVIEILRNC